MRGILIISILLFFCPALYAGDADTAAGVTELGRSIEHALDVILGGRGRSESGERTLLLLIDATPSLNEAGFISKLEYAIMKNRSRLGLTEIGLARLGHEKTIVMKPTANLEEVIGGVKEMLRTPETYLQNAYSDIRRLASYMVGKSGVRELVLVTLENGDMEDDLESTVAALSRSKVKFSVITREAYLSDSYWAMRQSMAPRGCKLTGCDSAFVDLPWGWLFQNTSANEVTPSGFAVYGLSRLAGSSGGKVFLYTAPASSEHRCFVYSDFCPFCNGDHLPEGDLYQEAKVHFFAPSIRSRNQAFKEASGDPCFSAFIEAWKKASKAGLVRSLPSLRAAGRVYKEERNQVGRQAFLFNSVNFNMLASRADKLSLECRKIVKGLEEGLAKESVSRARPRFKAMADLTRVMLHITHVNLIAFSAWNREVAPYMSNKKSRKYTAPEFPWYETKDRPTGVYFRCMSLCHGVCPFLELRLPGGEAFKDELRVLDNVISPFLEQYQSTPFALAVRRSGIARFHLHYPVELSGVLRRDRFGSEANEPPDTRKARPYRPGGYGGTTTGGPETGGGGGR
jgi:hypothetical protein